MSAFNPGRAAIHEGAGEGLAEDRQEPLRRTGPLYRALAPKSGDQVRDDRRVRRGRCGIARWRSARAGPTRSSAPSANGRGLLLRWTAAGLDWWGDNERAQYPA